MEAGMKGRFVFTLAVVGGLLLGSSSAFAHHGTAISYDNDKSVTVKGTVTEFVWANPHGQLHWDVKSPDGKTVAWGGELHSIALMTRAGWNKKIVKSGDEVTVTGHPSKFGTPYMVVTSIVLGGKEYFRDLPQN
jgi:hypothetical protein